MFRVACCLLLGVEAGATVYRAASVQHTPLGTVGAPAQANLAKDLRVFAMYCSAAASMHANLLVFPSRVLSVYPLFDENATQFGCDALREYGENVPALGPRACGLTLQHGHG